MSKTTEQIKRKPLRQRVADRRAGVKPAADPRRARILRGIRLAAYTSQGVGLIMLLVLLAQYISSGYGTMNWVSVMVYAGLFLAGRAATSFLNLTNINR